MATGLLALTEVAGPSPEVAGAETIADGAAPVLHPVTLHEPEAMPKRVAPEGAPDTGPKTLFLPEGFDATIYSRLPVSPARALAMGPQGVLYVSVPRYGAVDALRDADGDGYAEVQTQLVGDLDCPYGLAVHDDWLYVAQNRHVSRFRLSPSGDAIEDEAGELLVNDLPAAPCAPHGFRPLALDPDAGALYVAVGSTCNACIEPGAGADRRAAVWRYPLAAPGPGTAFARGLRNIAALALNPWEGSLWGVGPERDDLGDDVPPDLITRLEQGGNYGWPSCYVGPGGAWHVDARVPPPEGRCDGLTRPTRLYQAHSSPLGLTFHDGRGLPASFGPSLFVALHGSWDHSTGVGYRVIRYPLDGDGVPAETPQDFALGWLTHPTSQGPAEAWGRPVDLAVAADGALFVSDDASGTIYRLAYGSTTVKVSAHLLPVP